MKELFKFDFNNVNLVVILSSLSLNITLMMIGNMFGISKIVCYTGIACASTLAGPWAGTIVGIISGIVYAYIVNPAEYILILDYVIIAFAFGILAASKTIQTRLTLFKGTYISWIISVISSLIIELKICGYFFDSYTMTLYELYRSTGMAKFMSSMIAISFPCFLRCFVAVYVSYIVFKILKHVNLFEHIK